MPGSSPDRFMVSPASREARDYVHNLVRACSLLFRLRKKSVLVRDKYLSRLFICCYREKGILTQDLSDGLGMRLTYTCREPSHTERSERRRKHQRADLSVAC